MAVADRSGLPLAARTASASPHDVTLLKETLRARFIKETPERVIGDRAYDSDSLDERLLERSDTETIAPHREDRVHKTQDGRPLRRYKRRWKVKRLFAWLQNFRRLVRDAWYEESFLGSVQLGSILILLRPL